MIIDTSALIAILRDEPEAIACARAIEAATSRRVSAANFVEAAIVIDGSQILWQVAASMTSLERPI